MADSGSLPPSARRLARARAEGDVPRSALLPVGGALLLLSGLVAAGGPAAIGELTGLVEACLAGELASPSAALRAAASVFVTVVGVAVAVIALGAALVELLQVGPLWAPAALRPAAPRLSPAVSSPASLAVGLALAMATLAIVAGVGLDGVHGLAGRPDRSAAALSGAAVALAAALAFRLGLVWSVAGLVDLAFVAARRRARLRMTRADQRREAREAEGEPEMRRRRARALRRAASAEAPSLDAAALVVRGARVVVVIAWPSPTDPPSVTAIARAPLAAATVRDARRRGVPVASDEALASVLARSGVGGVPSRAAPRLARHLARSRR